MNTCPACTASLAMNQAFMCVSGRCDPEKDAPGGVPGPVRTVTPTPGEPRPDWVTCPQCSGVQVEVCTQANCRFPLPTAWRDSSATVVAMAGARATGKSIYIAVLVKQLQQYGELARIRVSLATPRCAATYQEVYEKPLYQERGMIAPTTQASIVDSPERDPLVLELGTASGARHYLVLRDVSGEDLANPTPDVQRLRYFSGVDAVLFLFDPLALPDVRAQLAGLVSYQAPHGTDDPRIALNNVLRLITPTKRTRFAVVLSKFDVLQALRVVDGTALGRIMQHSGAAFSREPSWRGHYDDEDSTLLHEEVRSLLRWLKAGDLVTAMDQLSATTGAAHRFFAVSALGDAPEGSYLHDRGIAPFRCLDPARWVLSGQTF